MKSIRDLVAEMKEKYLSPNFGGVCPTCECPVCNIDREAIRKGWKSFIGRLQVSLPKVGIVWGMPIEEYAEMKAWFDYRDKNLYKTFYNRVGGEQVIAENRSLYYGYTVMLLNKQFWNKDDFLLHFLQEEDGYSVGTVIGIQMKEEDFFKWLEIDKDTCLPDAFVKKYDVVYLVK